MVNGVLVDVENLRDCFRVVRRFVTLYQQFPCFIVQHFYHLLCLLYTCCKGVTAFVRIALDPDGLFAIQGLLLAGMLAACTLLLSGCAAKTDCGAASPYKTVYFAVTK